MSEPKAIGDILPEVMRMMERLYQHPDRPKYEPKPFELPADWKEIGERKGLWSKKWEPPPDQFLDWWSKHHNCNINPITAWNCATYRQQYYNETKEYW